MCLKAQDADDIYWIGKDEAKRESWKSGNSGKKETNSTTHHSNTNASTLENHPVIQPQQTRVVQQEI
jgi:hypothetical protein